MRIAKVSSTLPGTNQLPPVPIPDDLREQPIQLSENARTVLQKRYLRRGKDGKPAETEAEMFWRVAYYVALAEDELGGDVLTAARSYYELLTGLRFFPNSPTFTGAGTPLGQLAACFTADMRVTTSEGLKRIADLEIGEQVLTHEGRYRTVSEVFERAYTGGLLKIRIKQIGTPLEVTPEHPILTPQGWVRAGDLKVGDYVAVGKLDTVESPVAFDLAELQYPLELEVQQTVDSVRARRPARYQNSGLQGRWVARFVPNTPNLARLAGYYVAEGTLGTDCEYVRFTFSKDETAYHQDVINLLKSVFGLDARVGPSNFGNWVTIDVFNRPVANWFRDHFGSHSYGKKIPLWMQQAETDYQEQFLIGLWRGDGLFYERKQTPPSSGGHETTYRKMSLVLANPTLIHQVWQLCLRLGFDASIRPADTKYVTPNARDTAMVSIPPMQAQPLAEKAFGRTFSQSDKRYIRQTAQRIDGKVYFQVKQIEVEEYCGTVYNCEVDEDHSYVIEGVVVHNCFVLAIDDDMGRSESGIFQTLRNAALIQQTGGGNGFAFSRLRPKGALVNSSRGEATGPVGFLRVYDQAFGEIAQGGCLTPDTLVFTHKGTLRLDEIVTHAEVGWQEHTLTVATDEGDRQSNAAFNHGVAPVLRVRTAEGLSLTGTPNHKVKVMSQQGGVWRRLDELQPGDSILVKLGQHRGEFQPLRQPEKHHGNQFIPILPSILDEELAFLLGLLYGDGFVASGEADHRVGITVAHSSYLMEALPQLLKRILGEQITINRQQKPDDASMTFVIDNRALKDFLSLNGLAKKRSAEAQIPQLIRQSPPEVVGAFLRGLFEADGALSHHYPMLVSTSERLIRDASALLIGLGCPTTIRQQPLGENHFGDKPIWQLRIHSFVGLEAWRTHIGCDSRSRFQECMNFAPDLGREASYALPQAAYWVEPVLAATQLAQIDARHRGTGKNFRATSPSLRKQLLRYTRGERQLTRSGYAHLSEQYPEFAQETRPINDLWFVEVTSVESAGEALTLDLEVYDNHTYLANGMVTHNSRRGANMAVLKVAHPDIREFITSKTNESHITNFNISVGITDDFMKAVEADAPFDLINPHDGKVWETVRAREIFDLIVKHAHHNGEPGVLFLDAANRANPVPHLYELESTNPCGEQYLGPFENCCLGSINLAQLPIKDGQPDWDTFKQWIETSTRFLDDVVTANAYVPSVPQLAEAAHRVRRIGLGIMGLADLMYRMAVRYGSEEGQEFAGQVTEFLRYHAMRTSIELAQERGAFPAIKGSIYDPDDLKWTPPTPLFPYSRQWGRPALDWNQIVQGIKEHGIRNGAQLTVAPTGTIATVSGCEGYGCEPVFALAYIRHVNDKGRDLQLQYTSPLFEQALQKAGLSQEKITRIVEYVNAHGSCQGAPDLPESIRHTFVSSSDVSVDEHIRMQAAMQCFVDNAISKTVNAPAGATEQDVAKAYQLGWKLGCKGLTVYVTGSREKVVLETHATAKAKQEGKDAPTEAKPAAVVVTPEKVSVSAPKPKLEQTMLFYEKKKPRPRRLSGRTYRVGTPLGATYITINENGHGEGNPFELFIHTSKAGSETAAVSEAIGRLSSMILRMASPLPPRERMREIIKQLEGIGGERSIGFGAQRVRSLPDGVAQVLKEYLEETIDAESIEVKPVEYDVDQEELIPQQQLPMPIGDLCPECGEASVVNEEGCRKCYSCGYSEC